MAITNLKIVVEGVEETDSSSETEAEDEEGARTERRSGLCMDWAISRASICQDRGRTGKLSWFPPRIRESRHRQPVMSLINAKPSWVRYTLSISRWFAKHCTVFFDERKTISISVHFCPYLWSGHGSWRLTLRNRHTANRTQRRHSKANTVLK